MPQGTAPALKRSIGLVRATAMVVGTIVGASIFVQPSVITGEMRSVGGVVLAWTLAGVLTLAGALICAELASAYPRSGGVYVFLRESYSPALGFLWGWATGSPPTSWRPAAGRSAPGGGAWRQPYRRGCSPSAGGTW